MRYTPANAEKDQEDGTGNGHALHPFLQDAAQRGADCGMQFITFDGGTATQPLFGEDRTTFALAPVQGLHETLIQWALEQRVIRARGPEGAEELQVAVITHQQEFMAFRQQQPVPAQLRAGQGKAAGGHQHGLACMIADRQPQGHDPFFQQREPVAAAHTQGLPFQGMEKSLATLRLACQIGQGVARGNTGNDQELPVRACQAIAGQRRVLCQHALDQVARPFRVFQHACMQRTLSGQAQQSLVVIEQVVGGGRQHAAAKVQPLALIANGVEPGIDRKQDISGHVTQQQNQKQQLEWFPFAAQAHVYAISLSMAGLFGNGCLMVKSRTMRQCSRIRPCLAAGPQWRDFPAWRCPG